jgi:hypothetical protein
MTSKALILVPLLIAIISLFGCSLSESSQEVKPELESSSSGGSSLHNFDTEMLTEGLKNHPDFPELNIDETETEEVTASGRELTVTYSSKTEIRPNGTGTTPSPENGDEEWSEETQAEYFITLKKVWETEQGNVESYWKYEYDYQNDEVKLIESEDNDNKVNQ